MSPNSAKLKDLKPIQKVERPTVLATAPQLTDEKVKGEINLTSQKYVKMFSELHPNSPEFKGEVKRINEIGQQAVERLGKSQSGILNRKSTSLAAAKKSGDEAKTHVSEALIELSRSVDSLMPDGRTFKPRNKILRKLPFIGDPLEKHLVQFDSSADHLKNIVLGLEEGKKELIRDNEEIEQSRRRMWDNMAELAPAIYEVQQKKAYLKQEIQAIEASAQEAESTGDTDTSIVLASKAEVFKAEALHALNQREMDLYTQLTVGVHAYLGYDLAVQNNDELIKGVERVQNTTLLSLESAVTLAEVLHTQTTVVNAIDEINKTTNALIAHTGETIAGNAAAIRAQASSSGVDPEILRKSLMDIKDTVNAVTEWKIQANDAMESTIKAYEETAGAALGMLEDKAEALETLAAVGEEVKTKGLQA